MLATDGENLYREDLSKDLKEHFQDVLDALEEQGAVGEDLLLGIGIGWHFMFACLLVCLFVVCLFCQVGCYVES